jgi:putative transposase
MSGDRYRITDQHQTYFVTCTIVDWIDLFTRKEYKDIIIDSLDFA